MSRRDSRDPQKRVSLLVRNLPLDARPEEVRAKFERYGEIRDIYLPKDYYTNRPRGFGFIEFKDNRDAEDALYHLDRSTFMGRELSVVLSKESRKTPRDMIQRERGGGGGGGGGGYRGGGGGVGYGRDRYGDRDRYRERSPRRYDSRSRSRSPPRRERSISRSRSPPRRERSISRSPVRRADSPRDDDRGRSRSPAPADSPARQHSGGDRDNGYRHDNDPPADNY